MLKFTSILLFLCDADAHSQSFVSCSPKYILKLFLPGEVKTVERGGQGPPETADLSSGELMDSEPSAREPVMRPT